MKKNFSYYLKIWVILFVLFNIVVFALPVRYANWYKFGGSFWSGYIFIIITFIIQIFVSYKVFNKTNKTRLLYKIPLIQKSFTTLIIMIICGLLCMFYPDLNWWIGALTGTLILAFSTINLINTNKAGEDVVEVEEKVKSNTDFIKNMISDAQSLMNNANDDFKNEYKKVYEALRYSDPVSNEKLKDIEKEISDKFICIKNDTGNKVLSKDVDDLLSLIKERNNKCKLYK